MAVMKNNEPDIARVQKGAWIFGEFEGHFTQNKKQLFIERGIIRQAKATDVEVSYASEDFVQEGLTDVWIEFEGEDKTFDVTLINITLRNYALETIKVDGDVAYGHSKGLIWAKYNDVKRSRTGSVPLWPYFLVFLLLLIHALSPENMMNRSQDQWRRVVSPTLPKQDDQIDPVVKTANENVNYPAEIQVNEQPINHIGMCDTQLRLDASVLFDRNEFILKEGSKQELNKLKPLLTLLNDQALVLRVIGHTDSIGSDAFNQKLSIDRAQAIADWLTQEANIAENRIRVEGKGESELLSDDLRDQHLNRRVEIGFVCTLDGVPFIYTQENSKDKQPEVIPFNENEDNVLVYVPNGIRVEDALKKPSVFLNSCGRPLLLSSDLLFQFDRATLQPQAIEQLKEIASVLNDAADHGLKLKIVGHTDANGDEEHNQRLSFRRAKRVADWLDESNALKRNQIVIEGEGETSLIVPATASIFGQRFNRRVEMIIVCSSNEIRLDS